MSPRFYGIALRKVRHDAAGERFVVILRDRSGDWHAATEYGELDGEAAWSTLADHGLWSERIALILDDARERFQANTTSARRLPPALRHSRDMTQ